MSAAVAPWAMVEADPDHAAAELAHRFPGVSVWQGKFTGAWWAMTRDRSGCDLLVEAPNPAALGRRLQELAPRVRGFTPRYSRTGLRGGADGRMQPRPAPAPWPPRPSRQIVPAVTASSRAMRKPKSGWLRRLLGLLVVLED